MGKKLEKTFADIRENPSSFVFHASDEYHHSEFLRVKMGTDQLRFVEEVKSCGAFPYRTESDVIRHAIFFLGAWLSEQMGGKWAEPLRAMKRMHLINALAESRRESARWLDDLAKNMSDPSTTERQKTELIENMYDTIMSISSENEERELWLKALQERYPKYCPKGFDMSRLTD